MWKFRTSKRFQKSFNKLEKTTQKSFDTKVKELGNSPDPSALSDEKANTKKHGRVYIMRLNRSQRLAYRVYVSDNIIELVAVGDHKEVYDKD